MRVVLGPIEPLRARGPAAARGKNRWELMIYLRHEPDGKKLYRWHKVNGTRSDAQRELARLVNAVNTSTYTEPTKVTVGEFLERTYAKSHVAATTYQRYEQIDRQHLNLIPGFGHIPLPTSTFF